MTSLAPKSPADVVSSYYEAYQAGDLVRTASFVHEDCIVDEPDFLPYGRVNIVGAQDMFERIGGTFFRLFQEDTRLEGTRYFEHGDSVITSGVWIMTGKFTGNTIRCHYQEYFEIEDGRIRLMRPFYHAAKDMLAEIDAAEKTGVSLEL
ncbi:MAG: nuclear transport factor 2 family protein [Parvibaculaceae bacterium]